MRVEEAYSNQMRARYGKALSPTHRWGGGDQGRTRLFLLWWLKMANGKLGLTSSRDSRVALAGSTLS